MPKEAEAKRSKPLPGAELEETPTELVALDSLKPHPKNYKTHPEAQIAHIEEAMRVAGVYKNVVIAREGTILMGHGVVMAARKAGRKKISARRLQIAPSDVRALKLVALDNEVSNLAEVNEDALAALLRNVIPADGLLGSGLSAEQWAALVTPATPDAPPGNLAEQFLVPPFSVLDARQGYWQERKRSWLSLGIQSEVGRGENLLKMSDTLLQPDPKKRAKMKQPKNAHLSEQQRKSLGSYYSEGGTLGRGSGSSTGTSIFDPVLCELAYTWFVSPRGTVLDPFAGGSVRGIVASKLGRKYVGVDLRSEQVAANREQAKKICGSPIPSWVEGDSVDIGKLVKDEADLIFSCPPYGDLEIYSDDPRDLSTLDYPAFVEKYRKIISSSVALLRPDRFAVFVVGDIRDRKGFYRRFVSETEAAFEAAGARLYNEAILVTAVGTLSIRAGRVFSSGRKLGKTHQNVLVFCKGDPAKAAKAAGKVEVSLPPAEEVETAPND